MCVNWWEIGFVYGVFIGIMVFFGLMGIGGCMVEIFGWVIIFVMFYIIFVIFVFLLIVRLIGWF